MSALDDIAAERRRQIDVEGWTAEHDDEHTPGELALAGATYAANAAGRSVNDGNIQLAAYRLWPWDRCWWKPKPAEPRRDLVRAAALIVAEIEAYDRRAAPPSPPADEDWHRPTLTPGNAEG